MLNNNIDYILDAIKPNPLTPLNICYDMISLLDDKGFFNKPDDSISIQDYIETHRVCDIYCKSGNFLTICYLKFVQALHTKFETPEELDYFIWRYLLYGICPSVDIAYLLVKKFYGGNSLLVNDESMFGNFYIYNSDNTIPEELKDMKFDVVVGNPPYNNDIYLDFVEKGHSMSKEYSLWITPAKWQAKSGESNKRFRSIIRPLLDRIVVYKTSTDVFDIFEAGGICYYLCSNNITDSLRVLCKSKTSDYFNSDFEEHTEDDLVLIPNRLLSIVNKFKGDSIFSYLDFKQSKYIKNTYCGHKLKSDATDLDVLQGDSICGYLPLSEVLSTDRLDYFKCYTNIMPGVGVIYLDNNGTSLGLNVVNKAFPNQIPKGSYPCLCYFKTEKEADGFISFCNTKSVKFLHLIGVCGTTITKEFWRFIPNPGDFDCIYEDKPLDGYYPNEDGIYIDNNGIKHCSLYSKYNISDDEIAVIESVIRDRK